jgi:DNA-binding NarL/FixJ family response regulator
MFSHGLPADNFVLVWSKKDEPFRRRLPSDMSARILTVDDDRDFRGVLRGLLTEDPQLQLVGEAQDGEEAVRSTRDLNPDIVLMDITMPRVNGLEASRTIKSFRPETKIIILTVHSESEYKPVSWQSGADAFIAKKRLGSELLPTIRRVLGTSASHKSNTNQEFVSLLIVDDDELFLRFASDYLTEQHGIVVAGCANGGYEGLAKASLLKPDVVLVDCDMPDLTGLEVMHQLRRKSPQSVIIALTACDPRRFLKAAFAAGANAFVPKSGLMTELVPKLRTLAKIRPRVTATPRS